MCRGAPRFGNDLARHEKTELDPHAGESDAFPALLRACRNIVVACQLPPLHASAIVDDRQCRTDCVGQEANAGRTRVKRIRDHFGEDRLFEGPGVGIPKVFEEVLEVDSGFAHVGILSCGRICLNRTGFVGGELQRLLYREDFRRDSRKAMSSASPGAERAALAILLRRRNPARRRSRRRASEWWCASHVRRASPPGWGSRITGRREGRSLDSRSRRSPAHRDEAGWLRPYGWRSWTSPLRHRSDERRVPSHGRRRDRSSQRDGRPDAR